MRRAATALALVVLLQAGCLDVQGNRWAASATQLDVIPEGLSGRTVRIAVIDSGVDVSHPALRHLTDGERRNGELVRAKDFVGDRPKEDVLGHGTFVAGLLAAQPRSGPSGWTDPEARLAGLLPTVDLLSARVCVGGDCILHLLDDAIRWAVEWHAQVIVLSLGFQADEVAAFPSAVDAVRSAIARADRDGIIIVAAAGNTGLEGGGVLFPASDSRVLAVGAVDRDLRVRPSSARQAFGKPDLVAPGEGITGPWRHHAQIVLDGTSVAAPFVAAAAALMVAADPPRTAADAQALRQALEATAAPVLGFANLLDPNAGAGLLQASDARASYLSKTTLR